MSLSRPERPAADERGQALPLLLGVVGTVLVGVLVLAAFGQALGGKSRHQRGADLAAVSAARTMRADYPRLFEAAVLESGEPNPRHLPTAMYLTRARAAAADGARRNGVRVVPRDVEFPGGGFAPTRVRVRVRGSVLIRVDGTDRKRRRRVAVEAGAAAELMPGTDGGIEQPAFASGGGYEGPLAYRMGKPLRTLGSPFFPCNSCKESSGNAPNLAATSGRGIGGGCPVRRGTSTAVPVMAMRWRA